MEKRFFINLALTNELSNGDFADASGYWTGMVEEPFVWLPGEAKAFQSKKEAEKELPKVFKFITAILGGGDPRHLERRGVTIQCRYFPKKE